MVLYANYYFNSVPWTHCALRRCKLDVPLPAAGLLTESGNLYMAVIKEPNAQMQNG